ncbi:hypothetical protein Dimus_033130 [Dionaea muscipula]
MMRTSKPHSPGAPHPAVPNVQELAKEPISQVPARYVRRTDDLLDPPFTGDHIASSFTELPVIDLGRLTSLDTQDSEVEKLDRACREWGFFQFINHGVSPWLVEDVKRKIEEFFGMPIEEKNKYRQLPGELEGFGQLFVHSNDQKLDWSDMFYLVTLPKHIRTSHLFKMLPLPFSEMIEAYSDVTRNLALTLLNFVAKALKIDPKYMIDLFDEGKQEIRINYYPPCPQPELVMGFTPHSDASALTILLQVNETAGLQVKKDDEWIPVKPLPGAFIVNVGDILEVVTNGTYRSIEHRAVVNSVKERLSIASFYSPRLEGEVGPTPSLITPETPAMYKTVAFSDFSECFFSRKLYGKSQIDQLKIDRS